MKKANKVLFLVSLVLILALTLTFGTINKSYAEETADSDGYIDLNDVEVDDEGEETTNTEANNTETNNGQTDETKNNEEQKENTNQGENNNTQTPANQTPTTPKNQTPTNTVAPANTANPTNTATKPAPQTGEFINGKVIAVISLAAVGMIIAIVKLKKFNY